MTAVRLYFILYTKQLSPLHVTVMSIVQLHFILYTKQLSPLHVTLMTVVQLHFILYTNKLFPSTCYSNDCCTVTFYPLYKSADPHYMLL